MQVISGTGKLYNAGGKEVIAVVSHQVWEKPITGNAPGEWGGEFLVDRVIWPSGEYIIELENGRRGTCTIDIEQEINDCPVNYRYGVKGSGALT